VGTVAQAVQRWHVVHGTEHVASIVVVRLWGSLEQLETKIQQLQLLTEEYEHIAFPETVADAVKVATLIRGLVELLKTHIEVMQTSMAHSQSSSPCVWAI
jgi:hypothetical protein